MKSIFTAILLFALSAVYAQRCATVSYNETLNSNLATYPFSKGTITHARDTLPNEVIVVPVVIHVLYNNASENISDQRIMDQLNALNNDYRRRNADTMQTPEVFKHLAADTRIVFCLAKTDPNGEPTTGIIRKYTTADYFLADDQMKYSSRGGDDGWDPSKYLNIWVCSLFGRTLGYATMPGGPAAIDGIVIKNSVFGYVNGIGGPFNKGRTLTHESGHWLGLHHIWGDAVCGDDGIDDTPPQKAANHGCSQFPKLSDCSVDSNGDMFMNYMDFSDDGCMNMFTTGQKNRMRAQFAKGGLRNSILNSNVCEGGDVQAGPMPKPESPSKIQIYPNPAIHTITIAASSLNEVNGKTVRIYNIQGKLLIKKNLQAQKTTISLEGYAAGIYLVVYENMGQREIYKIVKSN